MATSALYHREMVLLTDLFAKEPLYTKKGLEAAESSLLNINLFGHTFNSVDIHGNPVERMYPDPTKLPNPPLPQKVLTYQTYQQLAFPMLKQPGFIPPDYPFHYCAYGPRDDHPSNSSNQSSAPCCLLGGPGNTRDQEQIYEHFRFAWWSSSFCQQLTAHFEKHYYTMERVDKIIAIGLGRLALDTNFENPPYNIARNFLKHMQAVQIQRLFKNHQYRNIDIFVQDPGYCTGCIVYLESRWGMIVLSDPAVFHSVDANTFVISRAPKIPVRQIVTDVTKYCGGPAGMLCDVIDDDGMMPIATADPSSPRCMEYRQQSELNGMSCVLDDSTDKFWFRGNLQLPGKVFGRVGLYLKKAV